MRLSISWFRATEHSPNPSAGYRRNRNRLATAKKKGRCGGCGAVLKSHYDVRPRLVRDLSCGNQQVFLEVPICRMLCLWCGVKTEELEWLADIPRYTRRFGLFVGHRCRESNVDAVAEELGLDWETVKNLDKLYMNEQLRLAGSAEPTVIGIDEIAVGKRHKYQIVVSDLLARRPIWFGGTDRSEASLDAFFTWLGPEKSSRIRLAVMDMWKAFRKSTLKPGNAPQARIVYDKFHIIGHLGKAIDLVRKSEYKRVAGDDRRYIKGKKYTLLARWNNLNEDGQKALRELFRVNRRLNTAYLLKESFGQLWSYVHPGWARRFFDRWRESLCGQGLPPFEKFAKLVEAHWDGIEAYCHADNKVALGFVEGLNNRIRAIQRQAYGFHDPEYFRLKILTCMLPKLPI